MCNPTVLFATQAVVGVASAVAGGLAERSAAKANEKIQRGNAKAAKADAAADELMQRRQAAKIIGQSRVDFAKAGVARTGSALDILEQETMEAELDALKIRAGGATAATGYRNEARMYGSQRKAALTGSVFNSGNALLSGATAWSSHNEQMKLLKGTG